MIDSANKVSIEMQRLSYMANAGLISQEHFIAMWGPTFASAWDVLEVWVKHKRLKNGEAMELKDGAYSRKDFEVFALLCKGQ